MGRCRKQRGRRTRRNADERARWRKFRKDAPRIIGALTPQRRAQIASDPYGTLLEKLTEEERTLALRAGAHPAPPEALMPRTVRMLTREDAAILLTWAQAAYARGSGLHPGRCWFDDFETQAFPLRAMAEGWVFGLTCASHDLDQAARITRQLDGARAGVLRLPHDTVMPVGTGRAKDGLAWVLALNDDHDGGLFYWPEMKTVTRLRAGHAILFPRTHAPGVTRIDPARGARFTLESHAPPRRLREVILSDAPPAPRPAPGTAPPRPSTPPADRPRAQAARPEAPSPRPAHRAAPGA